MIPALYPFQLDLCQRLRTARQSGHRVIVAQAATGAGKTTVGCHLTGLAVAKGSPVLHLVHRRRLVEQISDRLGQFGIDHGILMRGQDRNGGALVQVASRDTLLSRCVRNEWLGLPPAKLILVDEGHHAADPQSEYRRILANYDGATVILLTATPVGPGGEGLGPWATDIQCAAPTSQLVREGFLVPVRCYAPDRAVVRGKVKKRGLAGDLVASWQQYAEDSPTVLFCARVQHSRDAVAAFAAAGIPAAHVDADTPDDDRDRIYDGLSTGLVKVVSNVGIIKEGVDIPCLRCCQLFMETGGRVAFLQALGRVMRRFPGKEYAILIDHAGAVFRHGFPDEDTEWTLEGDADAAFRKKKDAGLTAQVHYCKPCEMLYKDQLNCPKCGRLPQKPPRSIFAPPPVDLSNEILTEADRNDNSLWAREEKVRHWLRCVAIAVKRGGNFWMAAAVYRRKYGTLPDDDFPCVPGRDRCQEKLSDVYPNFGRRQTAQ